MFHTETDLKLQKLCQENEELAELMHSYEDEVRFLLSQITHEIRNPLTLLYSTLQLIEKKQPSIKEISYWPTLREDMKEVFTLLDRLSEYNHSDCLHKTSLNLLTLLTDLKISFEPFAKEKNLLLTILLSDHVDSCLTSYLADGVKLKQVYTNLIKNAIEAAPNGGSIQIKASKECVALPNHMDTKKTFLCIAITNTGSSIAKEDLDSIFMPFVTTKQTGSGLGLPTAKRILASHDGWITASSTENTTTFTTYLPLQDA